MLIGAGADTTGTVLQGFFKIIALNPEATSKAQQGLVFSKTQMSSHR